jgi:hypothetical protein
MLPLPPLRFQKSELHLKFPESDEVDTDLVVFSASSLIRRSCMPIPVSGLLSVDDAVAPSELTVGVARINIFSGYLDVDLMIGIINIKNPSLQRKQEELDGIEAT